MLLDVTLVEGLGLSPLKDQLFRDSKINKSQIDGESAEVQAAFFMVFKHFGISLAQVWPSEGGEPQNMKTQSRVINIT